MIDNTNNAPVEADAAPTLGDAVRTERDLAYLIEYISNKAVRDEARRLLRILAQRAGAADKPGWKLMPPDATEAMLHAAQDVPAPRPYGAVYRAMFGAAPIAASAEASPAGVAEALIEWWEMKRPTGWNETQHYANPTINCVGVYEKRLAVLAAAEVTPAPATTEPTDAQCRAYRSRYGNSFTMIRAVWRDARKSTAPATAIALAQQFAKEISDRENAAIDEHFAAANVGGEDALAAVLSALHKHLPYPTDACAAVRAVQCGLSIRDRTPAASAAAIEKGGAA